METNGSKNKMSSFIQESSQSRRVYFLENAGAQVPVLQYHRLWPGTLAYSLEFFTHGWECKKTLHYLQVGNKSYNEVKNHLT